MAENPNDKPYSRFLGLPESVTTPDHYQLLGVKRFTKDLKIIKDAAASQNNKLRKWQNDNQLYQQVRKLEMEIASAMLVLVDVEKKQAYDQMLSQSVPVTEINDELENEGARLTEVLPQDVADSPPRHSLTRQFRSWLRHPLQQKDLEIPRWTWNLAGVLVLLLIGWGIFRPGADTASDERKVVSTKVLSTGAKPLIAPFDEATAKSGQQAWADFLGTQVVETNSVGMQLVLIAPGTFQMGDSGDAVSVVLTKPYFLGRTEITQAQWQAVMGTAPWHIGKPWKMNSRVREGPNYPATFIRWLDAIEFCQTLTERERKAGRLPYDWEYTLPTEVQWEYACRAGTTTAYSFGDDETMLGDYAWFGGHARSGGNARGELYAHTVGTKKPNAWGLLDMHGNVYEWCRDRYAEKLPGGRNPEVTSEGSKLGNRVCRGGDWVNSYAACRSAQRQGNPPSDRNSQLGFRVARVLSNKVLGSTSEN